MDGVIMETIYGLLDGLDAHVMKQLIAVNALIACGYFSWTLFGARTSLGDWDNPRKKFFPVWVVAINLALVLALS
jgi:hypothetical protein